MLKTSGWKDVYIYTKKPLKNSGIFFNTKAGAEGGKPRADFPREIKGFRTFPHFQHPLQQQPLPI
jgi:hypothetical protein